GGWFGKAEPGEAIKMFHFCRSLEKNIQLLTSSVTPFGVPPSPKGKAYLPDKREFIGMEI
ncbi:MAG: hypothetical protein IJB91_05690, partial [Oscillospiraceae bacterium]|nr:hypothetical protein [Oscillospiraceae bacterium]